MSCKQDTYTVAEISNTWYCLFCFQGQINAVQILAMAMENVRLWYKEINVDISVPVILVTEWRMTAVKVSLSNENDDRIKAVLTDHLIRSSISIPCKEIGSHEMNAEDWLHKTISLTSFCQKEIHFFSNINFPDKWDNQNVPEDRVKYNHRTVAQGDKCEYQCTCDPCYKVKNDSSQSNAGCTYTVPTQDLIWVAVYL